MQTRYSCEGPPTARQAEVIQQQAELDAFHGQFWAAHNAAFKAEKAAFVAAAKARLALADDARVPDAELAVFYKAVLDRDYAVHAAYNREWWRRNAALTWAQLRAALPF